MYPVGLTEDFLELTRKLRAAEAFVQTLRKMSIIDTHIEMRALYATLHCSTIEQYRTHP